MSIRQSRLVEPFRATGIALAAALMAVLSAPDARGPHAVERSQEAAAARPAQVAVKPASKA